MFIHYYYSLLIGKIIRMIFSVAVRSIVKLHSSPISISRWIAAGNSITGLIILAILRTLAIAGTTSSFGFDLGIFDHH
jgi:hypothetical protein